MKDNRIEIMVVNHHPFLRTDYDDMIASCDLFTLVAVTGISTEVPSMLKKKHADVLLLAAEKPLPRCIQTVRRILKNKKELKVILTNSDHDLQDMKNLLNAGVRAFIPEVSEEKIYLEIILEVHKYGKYYNEELKNALAEDGLRRQGLELPNEFFLTERELEIANFLCESHTVKQIGLLLTISPHTVNTHKTHIYRKAGVKSRTGLVN